MCEPISILFVCMGNICRSPLAQGVFGSVVDEMGLSHRFFLDSAGTGSWHVGDPPDPRGQAVARTHNIDISDQRCRQLADEDFTRFDLILAMDRDNLRNIARAAPSQSPARFELFMTLAGENGVEIPDPYYGGSDGFEKVYQTLARGSRHIAASILANQQLRS